jgi:hypothetical protein
VVVADEKSDARSPSLTKTEESELRDAVYSLGPKLALPRKGEWAMIEVLIVPNEVSKVYQAKRGAVRRLLRDIVKGGRPRDALLAAGYFFAVEEDIGRGAFYVQFPEERLDSPRGRDRTDSRRDEILRDMDKIIEKR